jgi:hypothetical protein
MIGTETHDEAVLEVGDDELSALALAADPDIEVPADAVPFGVLTGTGADGPLPAWYMPAAVGGRLSGWRRIPPALVVASLLVINASGLCITYGKLGW